MAKKIFKAPYLKVVKINNTDIIATSAEVDNTVVNDGFGRAPGRGMWDDVED